ICESTGYEASAQDQTDVNANTNNLLESASSHEYVASLDALGCRAITEIPSKEDIPNAPWYRIFSCTSTNQLCAEVKGMTVRHICPTSIESFTKPENILAQRDPLFKVVIANFGMAKVATGDVLLRTVCGTLKYGGPEMFPGMSRGHGPLVDVWSLGVMVDEWLYSVVNPPDLSQRRGETEEVSWFAWLVLLVDLLLSKLEDEDDDRAIRVLSCMIDQVPFAMACESVPNAGI
ncbi:hypothetical protein LTR49_028750, partial [Elasticomyces elasticus]